MGAEVVRLQEVILAALAGDEQKAVEGLRELLAVEAEPDRLMDLRCAASYVGLSEDALDRRARAGLVPSRQEGPRCKRFFLKSELDVYMRGDTPTNLRSAA